MHRPQLELQDVDEMDREELIGCLLKGRPLDVVMRFGSTEMTVSATERRGGRTCSTAVKFAHG